MDRNELTNRFDYHPPRSDQIAKIHSTIRWELELVAAKLDDLCPEGREKSLAMTKLEEAMMWANAAVARNQS